MLAHLAAAPAPGVLAGQLLAAVWDSSPDYQDPATVTVHVRRVRNKIEARSRAAPLDRHRVGRRVPVRAMSRFRFRFVLSLLASMAVDLRARRVADRARAPTIAAICW